MLYAVFFALIFLTILTVVTAGQFPKPFGLYIAFFIASLKATLVMAFFMHMYWDKPFNVLVFLSSFLFAALFVCLTLLDTNAYQDNIDLFPREAEPARAAQSDSSTANP